MKREDIIASRIFKDISFFQKVMRKTSRMFQMKQVFWYEDWKKGLMQVDTVIIFAPLRDLKLISFIKKTNPKIRIIYWFWNPVAGIGMPEEGSLSSTEWWSFDPVDCSSYEMKFNTTFYFQDINLPQNEVVFDAVFVGLDKGRKNDLENIQNYFEGQGLRPYFRIIESAKDKIDYSKYLEIVSRSKAIVDIIPKGQSGLTIRPMESMFFEKKLISTDKTLTTQDFYHRNNIFIVGMDDEAGLADFINSPYEPLDDQIVNRYEFSSWLKRFEKG